MKKRTSKLLSALLALVMVFTMLPTVAFAADDGVVGGRGTEEDPYRVSTWAGLKECLDIKGRNENGNYTIYVQLNNDISETDCDQIWVGTHGNAGTIDLDIAPLYRLDLMGHSLNVQTSEDQFFTVKAKKFIITDSVGGGTINANGCKEQVFYVTAHVNELMLTTTGVNGQLILDNISVSTDGKRVIFVDATNKFHSGDRELIGRCSVEDVKLTASESAIKINTDYKSSDFTAWTNFWSLVAISGNCEFTTTAGDASTPVIESTKNNIPVGSGWPIYSNELYRDPSRKSGRGICVTDETTITLNRSTPGSLIEKVEMTEDNARRVGVSVDGKRKPFNTKETQAFSGTSLTFYYVEPKTLKVENGDAYLVNGDTLELLANGDKVYPFDRILLTANGGPDESEFFRWEITEGSGTFDTPNERITFFDVADPAEDMVLTAKFTETIDNLDVTMSPATLSAGDTLSGQTFTTTTDGVTDNITTVWYRNGAWVKDESSTIQPGSSYRALVYLTAEDGYKFTKDTKVSFGGQTLTVSGISSDAKSATFWTPAYELGHEHTPIKSNGNVTYYDRHDDTHSPKCAICGEYYDVKSHSSNSGWEITDIAHSQHCDDCGAGFKYGKHNFGEPVVDGAITTITCEDCGYKQETYNSDKLIVDIKLDSIAPLIAGDKLPEITVSNYDGAEVRSVQWKKNGESANTGDTIEAGASYTFTVTVGCKDGYSLVPQAITDERGVKSTLDMNGVNKDNQATIDHEANEITRTFSYPGNLVRSYVTAEVTLPDTISEGMKLKDLADSASVKINNADYSATYTMLVTPKNGADILFSESGTKDSRTEWPEDTDYVLQAGDTIQFQVYAKDFGYVTTDEMTINRGSWTVADVNGGDETSNYCMVNASYKLAAEEKVISQVELALDTPVTDGIPDTSADFPSDARYTAGTVAWDGDPAKFAEKTAYKVSVEVEAEDGYTFPDADSINASVNGYMATVTKTDDTHITVSYTFPETKGEVAVTHIFLDKANLTLEKGTTETLTATVFPLDAADKSVTWTSDNPAVATVDSNGKVTAIAEGEATITAKAGDKTATCKVTVDPVKHTITVKDGIASTDRAAKGTVVALIPDTKEGYTFKEWKVIAGGVTVEGSQFTMGEADVEIEAVFKENTTPATEYTVAFDANGGSVTPASATTTDGKLTSLPTPTRSGYTFKGWFDAAKDGNKIDTDKVYTADTTIYAQWTKKSSGGSGGGGSVTTTYAIVVENASNGSVKSDKTSAAKGATVTLTVKADEGYALDKLTVTDANGKTIATTEKNGKYTFTMPASKVTVKGSFKVNNPNTGVTNPFTDVSTSDWFYDDAMYAYENGLMNGTSASTFGPVISTTRGMIVTILHRMEGSPAAGANPFDDVKSGSYYENAIAWAAANGIVKGYGEGKFGPDDNITREQMAAILCRYAEYKGYDTSAKADLSKFSDAASISDYAVLSMQWACGEGLISGLGDGTVAPQANATRAQVAAILHRFCENVAK